MDAVVSADVDAPANGGTDAAVPGRARVALLTNFLPPYRRPVLESLNARVGALRIFVCTPMERNRDWRPDWGELDVVVQRTMTIARTWRARRFNERIDLHVPLDTISLLRAFRPDVILSGEMGTRSAQAMLYGRATGTPVHIWATLVDHLEVDRGRARRMLRRWLLRRASGVIVNGAGGARYVRGFAVDEHRIARIPQTTAIGRFAAVPVERPAADARRILVVGRLSAGKGLDLLLHGLAIVAARRADRLDLTVVGDGPERAQLRAIPLPASVHVTWIGHVEYDALPALYAASGILAFPTLGDEWGLVVNESLASGVPVLGSRYSQAVNELVVDGENGWTFLPDSAELVARAVERALDTPAEQLARMRVHARNSVAALTPDAVAGRFAEALHVAV
ncbi:MAG: glycosyltransferase family 4 protein [Longimicrobiales bacterium]